MVSQILWCPTTVPSSPRRNSRPLQRHGTLTIKHHHIITNQTGKLKNAVRTVKRLLRKCKDSGQSEFLSLVAGGTHPLKVLGQAPHSASWGGGAKRSSQWLIPCCSHNTTLSERRGHWKGWKSAKGITTTSIPSHSSKFHLERLCAWSYPVKGNGVRAHVREK